MQNLQNTVRILENFFREWEDSKETFHEDLTFNLDICIAEMEERKYENGLATKRVKTIMTKHGVKGPLSLSKL